MPGVQRQGDVNSAGGVAQSGVSSVRVNGRPIVVNGISVTPHPCCGIPKCLPTQCFGFVNGGGGSVRVNGSRPVVKGSSGLCGHNVKTASTDVIIKG